MKEIRNILSEYEKNKEEQEMALATVVKVRGSSYRSPGARMLIRKDGRWTGSISGGCLEGDALRKARQIMVSKQPELVTYDTMDDDNDIGVGLGCNGIIDVLIEPISKKNNPTDRLKALLGMENVTVVATIFRSSLPEIAVGIQCQINQKGKPEGLSEDNDLNKAIYNDLEEVLVSRKATVKSYAEDKVEVFFELIEPSIDLQIFGGGFDARPVVELAKTLGWHVSVADECIAHIAPANFPSADEVKLCTRDFIPEIVQVKPYTAAVLMSHNYPYDYAVLKKLLHTPVRYIGMLGPKKRVERMFSDLEDEGMKMSHEDHHRIHSPIGLDIGAETPEEIAFSIIGEIQARFRNRGGGFLKYRQAPIHQRDGAEGQVFRQVYINQSEHRYKNQ